MRCFEALSLTPRPYPCNKRLKRLSHAEWEQEKLCYRNYWLKRWGIADEVPKPFHPGEVVCKVKFEEGVLYFDHNEPRQCMRHFLGGRNKLEVICNYASLNLLYMRTGFEELWSMPRPILDYEFIKAELKAKSFTKKGLQRKLDEFGKLDYLAVIGDLAKHGITL